MPKISQILVPIDFDQPSDRALELATSLAQAYRAKLTLLHVWQIPDSPNIDFMANSDAIARVEDAAVNHLAKALATLQKVLPDARSKLKAGQPAPAILEAIAELKPDLVVMGTHGRRGMGHALIGSVTEKLVRESPVPVLTVRASANH